MSWQKGESGWSAFTEENQPCKEFNYDETMPDIVALEVVTTCPVGTFLLKIISVLIFLFAKNYWSLHTTYSPLEFKFNISVER